MAFKLNERPKNMARIPGIQTYQVSPRAYFEYQQQCILNSLNFADPWWGEELELRSKETSEAEIL